MKYKNILFDLDGTLLPMNQDLFIEKYFGLLIKTMAPYGYEADSLFKAIWGGVKSEVMNDGSRTNEEVFWKYFEKTYGSERLADKEKFDYFYRNIFDAARDVANPKSIIASLIKALKEKGIRMALATQPVFPEVATRKRVKWAGLDAEDFEFISTYENSSYAKPNPEYFADILRKLDMKPEETLMVGNDVDEDMPAVKAGMEVYLITDYLINKEQKDISGIMQGSFEDLYQYLGL